MSVEQIFWKHCGKRRNCSLRAISPFPTVFSTLLENFAPFSSNLKLSFANSFRVWKSLKFVVWERVNWFCYLKFSFLSGNSRRIRLCRSEFKLRVNLTLLWQKRVSGHVLGALFQTELITLLCIQKNLSCPTTTDWTREILFVGILSLLFPEHNSIISGFVFTNHS